MPRNRNSYNPPVAGRSPYEGSSSSSNTPRNSRLPDKTKVLNTVKSQTLTSLTEGFYAGKWRGDRLWHGSMGIVKGNGKGKSTRQAAAFALRTKNLKLKKIVRVNWELSGGYVFYLTMRASNNNFYEAKVYKPIRERMKLIFIRPAVYYPEVDPEILIHDAPDEDADLDDASDDVASDDVASDDDDSSDDAAHDDARSTVGSD